MGGLQSRSSASPAAGSAFDESKRATAAPVSSETKKDDCLVCSDLNGEKRAKQHSEATAAAAAATALAIANTGSGSGSGEVSNASSDSGVVNAWEHNNINEKAAAASKSNPHRAVAYMHSGCPLNRREVGRAAWGYLHTVAAYYPASPSLRQQQSMAQFMRAMGEFFPCGYCADKTLEHIAKYPPQTATQTELSVWLCGVHNEVNERLGKPTFPCTPEALKMRWKTGPPNGGCK